MRYFLTILSFCLFTSSVWAQPINDECSGLIDLGVAPVCTNDLYTNIDATLSNIATEDNPSCFNGGIAQRDVFFSFTVDPSMLDVTITVTGSDLGPNSMSIVNPQIALYRGACMFDGMAEVLCASAADGETSISLDAIALTPGIPYFIRINDYSNSGTPNWGDFQVCVEEYIPAINIGESASSTSCFGTLYDSGGPDEDYSNDENNTFTVCPTGFPECIVIDVVSFGIVDGDALNIYGGADNTAPSIASLSGVGNGNGFKIRATSTCVTFQFISDGFNTADGFEVTWQCLDFFCKGSSFNNPTPIAGFPFADDSLTTCGQGGTMNETPCFDTPFLNGPETVFAYTSEGGYCAAVAVTNAEPGTGIVVLSGPLGADGTVCLGSATDGSIGNVNFEEAGTYYIVVANALGCTDFGLSITEAPCSLSPALIDALCNPLNGCVGTGIVSEFIFEDGFQDIPLNDGVNNGCWGGVGAESDYIWFTIQAAADGPFGFILEGTNYASDIDFNVWGPFTAAEACETPQFIIDAVTNTQPIRSSYAGGTEPTGLADIHPQLGYEIEDVYDCQGLNDDIVQTIAAQEGEVYVVLANDWGDDIIDGAISIDWGPSDPAVIGPFENALTIEVNDTSVCAGQTVLIEVLTGIDNIEWIGDHLDELSCTDCFTPTATPAETRVYQAVLVNTCFNDTIDITINIFDLDAGPDLTICIGEEFDIPAGQNFETATYSWSPPVGLEFSCTDCPTPSVVSQTPGMYEVPVSLTAEACSFMDIVTITVLNSPAPVYSISDDVQICVGETVMLGGETIVGNTYEWIAVPAGNPIDAIANPSVTPDTTTTYYLSINNGICPLPSLDSITVSVVAFPVIDIVATQDTVCLGDTLALFNAVVEEDVTYLWQGFNIIFNPDSVYTQIRPNATGTYRLIADRLGCQLEDTFNIEVIRINVNLNQPDTLLFCLGDAITLSPSLAPMGTVIEWNQADIIVNTPTLAPTDNITYIATVTNQMCIRMDTLYIQVDSIPLDMSIVADPMKESYCQGELVELASPIYEPANYPNIVHEWIEIGGETSDTLYNLVLTTVDTFSYIRTTESGACMNIDTIILNVITNEALMITPANPEICPGETVDLLLTANALGELSWSPAETLSCDDCPNPTASPSVTTTYTVMSDIDGCSVENSVTITVMTAPVINLINNQTACVGTVFDLNPNGAEAGSTYSWASSLDPDFSSTEASISVTLANTGTYSVTVTNSCGDATDMVTLTAIDVPNLVLPADMTACLGADFNLEAFIGNNQYVIASTWIYDNNVQNGTAVSYTPTTSGMATFSVVYGIEGGVVCGILTDSIQINVIDQFYTIDIETDPIDLDTISAGLSFTLNALVDPAMGFDYTYTWTGVGVETPNASTTLVNAPNPPNPSLPDSSATMLYTLMVSSPEGCNQITNVSIVVNPVSYDIPNIFSPNGDGQNDVFRLFTNTMPTAFSLKVFNRWGQLVFETNDPTEGWDGNIDGNAAPSDVYIYQMEATSPAMPAEPIHGSVTLMR